MDDLVGTRSLLEQGANVDAEDPEHLETPLMLARSDSMRGLLLDHGADIHARDDRGRTTFMMHPCPLLLEAGSKVNAQDDEGETALMRAVDRGDVAVIQYLIASGADLNLRNHEGQSALSQAWELAEWAPGWLPVIEMLVEAGAEE